MYDKRIPEEKMNTQQLKYVDMSVIQVNYSNCKEGKPGGTTRTEPHGRVVAEDLFGNIQTHQQLFR